MEKRVNYYFSRNTVSAWLMTLLLIGSAVARIVVPGMKGADREHYVWCQIVLPITACLLYALIALVNGKEQFYKTAIPVWMMTAYLFITVSNCGFGTMVNCLYAVCLFFFAVIYSRIAAGRHSTLLLFPLFLFPLGIIMYLHRQPLLNRDLMGSLTALPDALMILALLLVPFSVRLHPSNEYHPTWGDRSDGRRIRSLDPMNQVSPYIMVGRNESSNLFADALDIEAAERYVRKKRREGLSSFGLTHVLLACYVRGVAKYPGINRFIGGQKVYSHGEDIIYCMTIKKELSIDSPETVIKVHLNPHDTAEDVYRKMNAAVEEGKKESLDSNFDATAHAFTLIPGVVLKFIVWLLKLLDYFGLLPKFLLEVSPFHGSIFFTSMGSLGIPPIYHHLYDFGNLPVFGSFGCKRRAYEVQEDGTVVQRKYIDVKFVLDERIVDGHYYATFLKYYKRLLMHPEVLDNPPEVVNSDIP